MYDQLIPQRNIQDLPDNVLRNVVGRLDQFDLVRLAQTCEVLNYYSCLGLYAHVVITKKGYLLPSPGLSLCTTIRMQYLLRAIQNVDRRRLVKRIYVHYIEAYDIQLLTKLVRLLVEFKFENAQFGLDFLTEVEFADPRFSFLRILSYYTDIIQAPQILYENDEIQELCTSKVAPMMDSYQVLDPDDLFLLPTAAQAYRVQCNFQSSALKLQGLMSRSGNSRSYASRLCRLPIRALEFLDPDSVDMFLMNNKLDLPFLTTLSLTISEQSQLLQSLTDFRGIENFQVRLSKSVFSNEDAQVNSELIPFWSRLLTEDTRRLSLVNLNQNNLFSNSSIASRSTFSPSNMFYCLLKECPFFSSPAISCNLHYLNICFNNFFAIPRFSMDPEDEVCAFIVSSNYLDKKEFLFSRLFTFTNLDTLVILDYFYNWKPFLVFKNGNIYPNTCLNNTKYLFGYCHCEDCAVAKELVLSGQPLYESVISHLFLRAYNPVTSSGLHVLERPFENTSDLLDPDERLDRRKVIHLMLDNLVPDLQVITTKLPKLASLVLGGVLFQVTRADSVTVSAPYDEWTKNI